MDLEIDVDAPEFVSRQRIEFLVIMKKEGSSERWGFPDKPLLQRIFDFIRLTCDHDMIMDVAQWTRVDDAGIATIMLSTVNLPLMTQVRHAIRCFTQHPGYRFETYAKTSFVKKYGLTMYIPRENAALPTPRILRTLAYKYPALRCKMRIIHQTKFCLLYTSPSPRD